jgi:hypothetical protein
MNQSHELECPEEVLAAIAWYPDGLDADERGAVEAHAADCATCREELAFVRAEGAPLPLRPEAERVYARVLERIDAYEGRARAARPPAATAPLKPALPAPRRGRAGLGAAPARAAAALLLAASLGALATFVVSRLSAPGEVVYQAAGEAPEVSAPAPAAELALDVVFRPDATAERIHAALRAIGGEIVSGPTQLGVYRVRLAPTADASAAATVLRGEGQGVASFAELVPR